MEKIEQARNKINEFRDLINSDEAKEIRKETNLNQVNIDIATLNNYEGKELNDVMIAKIDEIIAKYDEAIIDLKEMLKNNNKVEDDYDLKEDNKVEDETVVEVVKTEEGKKQGKKGRGVVGVVTGVVLTAAIFFGISRIISCQEAKNENNETKDNSNNQTATESTQTPEVTTNDVVIPSDTTTTTTENKEPEVIEPSIDELIADELAKYEYVEGSTIRPEQYELMLNYANNNIKEKITGDYVYSNVMQPINDSIFNEIVGAANMNNNGEDVGHNIGNFQVSNLFLNDDVTKAKFAELDLLKDAMLNGDEETKKAAAEQMLYIMYQINNEVSASKETILINGNVYEGKTIMGHEFGKEYNCEFDQLNDSSDKTIYLIYINSLYFLSSSILKNENKIGNQTIFINEDGEKEVLYAETNIADLKKSIFDGKCEVEISEEVDENGEIIQTIVNERNINLYSEMLEASVKESNGSLEAEGPSLELKNN